MIKGYAKYIFVFFLSLYLLTFGGHLYSQDGREIWRVTCSLVEGPIFPSQYGIVPSLIGLPLYGLARLTVAAGLAEPAPVNQAGVYNFFASMQNALVMALAMALFYRVATLFYSRRRSFILTLALGLTTICWPYAKYYFYSPIVVLFLLWLFFALVQWRRLGSTAHLVSGGIALGMLLHTRLDSLLLLPGAVLYLYGVAPPEKKWRAPLLLTLAYVPFLLAALLFNYYRFDSLFGDPRLAQESFSTPFLYGLYGYLFSPGRSIFYYSPLLLLGVAGWRGWWRVHRKEMGFILYITLAYVLLYTQWCNWSANWCYGPRYFLKLVPFFMLTAGAVIGRGKRVGNLLFILLGIIGFALQFMAVSVAFNDALIESMDLTRHENDMTLLDPMLSLPVWNAGIIDGRGLFPSLYDYGWLHLAGSGMPRGWLLVPLALLAGLLWTGLRLLPLCNGMFAWLLVAVVAGFLAILALGVGANTGADLALRVFRPGEPEPYLVAQTRNVNFVDLGGHWQQAMGIEPGSIMEWRGTVRAPVGAGYRFGIMTTGPVEWYLDNELLLNENPESGMKYYTVFREFLGKGDHDLRLIYRLPPPRSAGHYPAARVTLYWHLPYTSLGVMYGEHFGPERVPQQQ